jgi:hypothetical protein
MLKYTLTPLITASFKGGDYNLLFILHRNVKKDLTWFMIRSESYGMLFFFSMRTCLNYSFIIIISEYSSAFYCAGTDSNPFSLDALAVFMFRVLQRVNHPVYMLCFHELWFPIFTHLLHFTKFIRTSKFWREILTRHLQMLAMCC